MRHLENESVPHKESQKIPAFQVLAPANRFSRLANLPDGHSEADPERSHNKQTSLFNVLAGSRQSRELDDRWNFQSGGCVISAAAILSRVCEDNEESRHGLD